MVYEILKAFIIFLDHENMGLDTMIVAISLVLLQILKNKGFPVMVIEGNVDW